VRIGVISDTHVPNAVDVLPHQIKKAFAGVDLILHAGDIYQPDCLQWLEEIAPVTAVENNAAAHFGNDPRVAEKRVISLESHAIGMVHDLMLRDFSYEIRPGVIARRGLSTNQALPSMVHHVFGEPVNIVIFGHTHHAVAEEHQGVLFVNPGSPVLPMQLRKLGQVALLDITPTTRTAQILDLAQYT